MQHHHHIHVERNIFVVDSTIDKGVPNTPSPREELIYASAATQSRQSETHNHTQELQDSDREKIIKLTGGSNP